MKGIIRGIILVFLAMLMIFTVACTKKDTSTNNNIQTKNETEENSKSTNKTSETDSDNLEAIFSKAKNSDNYYFEYLIEGENQLAVTYNMWVKGKKNRMDFSGDNKQQGSMYLNYETGEFYMYTKEQNTAIKVTTKPDNSDINPFSYINTLDKSTLQGYKKHSSTTLDGNKCLVYSYEYDKNKYVMYISEEYNIVLKYEFYNDNKLISSVYFKNFKVGSVTDDMVTLPKDVKVMDLGGQ